MNIIVKCQDCGREMTRRIVSGETVIVEVHGCQCETAGYLKGFCEGKANAQREFKAEDKYESAQTEPIGRTEPRSPATGEESRKRAPAPRGRTLDGI